MVVTCRGTMSLRVHTIAAASSTLTASDSALFSRAGLTSSGALPLSLLDSSAVVTSPELSVVAVCVGPARPKMKGFPATRCLCRFREKKTRTTTNSTLWKGSAYGLNLPMGLTYNSRAPRPAAVPIRATLALALLVGRFTMLRLSRPMSSGEKSACQNPYEVSLPPQ
jgi:hypothetical protein